MRRPISTVYRKQQQQKINYISYQNSLFAISRSSEEEHRQTQHEATANPPIWFASNSNGKQNAGDAMR
jgi:hypothetical protein